MLLTAKEAAEYFKLNEFTVYRLAKAGQIPSFKVGHSLRFRSDVLDRWMERKMDAERSMSVLIVDDEPGVVDAIAEIVRRANCEAVAAATGHEAIDRFGQQHFDLVLLDIMLPDTSGTEVFRHIKSVAPDTAVAIITGYADSQMAVEALSMGPLILLQKPLQVADIRQILATFARGRQNTAGEKQ